jgi:hypothetical protein
VEMGAKGVGGASGATGYYRQRGGRFCFGERRYSNSPIAKEAVNKGSEPRKVTRKEVPF